MQHVYSEECKHVSRLHIFRHAMTFLLFAAAAAGQSLYQTGFEAPTFSVGPINGQDSWNGSPTVVVENTLTNGGAQAVSITPAGLASLLASRSMSSYSVATNGNLVNIKIDMFVSATGSASNWSPIVAYGSQGLLAQVIVIFGSTARLSLGGPMVGSVAVNRGVWNTFEMDLDMTAQTVTASVNGTPIGTGTVANSPGNIFNMVEFGLNSLPGSDTGTFDNLIITTPNAPPPPGSSVPALNGLGLAGLASLLMVCALFLIRRQSTV